MSDPSPLGERASRFFLNLQGEICSALESADGKASFREDTWQRAGGGGGRTRVLENGALLEKAGVNFSSVHGELLPAVASKMPIGTGNSFFATGVSLVLHPWSPMVPTVHANFRYLERGNAGWFGGGTDLTPYYPYVEDAIHFHRTLKDVCDRFDTEFYPRFKKWCDEYFFIKHRDETRGVGGLFFDYLTGGDTAVENRGQPAAANVEPLPTGHPGGIEFVFEFVQSAGRAFLPAYLPIVERRRAEPFTEREREHQLIRRGRYVEFNLVYDRGTTFGLETSGRTESILMSLPPLVRWVYDYQPEPGSREDQSRDFFRPRDWLSEAPERR
ncbi:MAG TPA: oxygen-dependent coproporphyrinogen oxidase [Blastocatellia bacterium]|nr:oxygen-dependent coproporphyrinogen oxidase [Blastocatellia bacterium]